MPLSQVLHHHCTNWIKILHVLFPFMFHDDYIWTIVTALQQSGWLELLVEFTHWNQLGNFQHTLSNSLCLYVSYTWPCFHQALVVHSQDITQYTLSLQLPMSLCSHRQNPVPSYYLKWEQFLFCITEQSWGPVILSVILVPTYASFLILFPVII